MSTQALNGRLSSRRLCVEDLSRMLKLFIEQTFICIHHTRTAFSVKDFKKLDKLQIFILPPG